MAKHIWSVLCSKSCVDAGTNQLSLFEVIEQLQPQGPITEEEINKGVNLAVSMQLVSFWTRENPDVPEEGLFRLYFLSPDKTKSKPKEFPITLASHKNQRHITKIEGFSCKGTGVYWCVVQAKEGKADKTRWATVSEIPIEVVNLLEKGRG